MEWSVPDEPTHGLLDEWFLPGCRQQSSCQRPTLFLPVVQEELTKKWRAPYFVRVNPSTTVALTTIHSTEETGYSKLPPLEETVAAYLCLPSALGLKAHAAHPSKPCRTTSSLTNRAYAAAGQAGSALGSAFKELCTATNLALRATKATAQVISKTMASLVVLERHQWLNQTEIRDAEKMTFLDSPFSLKGLFGPAVDKFAELFSQAKKTLQALHHFLPKHSVSATASNQKAPATQPQQKAEQHPQMAKRFPFPKCQGPHP